ncbi:MULTISPECIES: DUF881 domain-containing protein [Nocardioides]|uniref:DUF881 domain-containing protein n=1 Tax=Nocardioides TaxID=1839 RepID=UPI002867D2CB|nr:DUF881 domain-containing protein [Nocardioides sp. CGMCC 1.13656]
MSGGSHARPSGSAGAEEPPRPRRTPAGRRRWRVGTPLVVLACGALFVVSAVNSDGTELRPGRYTDLASLVEDQADAYAELEDEVAALDREVTALSKGVADTRVNRFQKRIEELKDPAGLVERRGPGVTITLSDAPEDVINSATGDLNPLLVHQQDIQAVVNALWKGGATAVTVQGQRVVSTTGIKCEGNAVQLQGVPYPQPYVISAVGDQADLLDAVDGDDYLAGYREDADDPDIAVGWDLELENVVVAPAYAGLQDFSYATPLATD